MNVRRHEGTKGRCDPLGAGKAGQVADGAPARSVMFMVGLLAATAVAGGCVRRTITVTSDPPGALVHLNDVEVGRTPVTVPFTFYGTYDVRLERDGYQTLHTATRAQAPWWEAPGPDLVAEVLPGDKHVDLAWHYELEPFEPADPELLLDHARQLRATFDRRRLEDAQPAADEQPADEPAADEEAEEG